MWRANGLINGSALLSFDCDLRQFPGRNNYDTIFLIRESAPTPASSPHVFAWRVP
jgi:hypothetical protein